MPTYEYKCRECNHRFEVVQSFSDEPLTECKECGGALGKVFGNIGITFKGSGFYKTDSRSTTTATKPNGKDKSESKSDSKPSESKSDSKSSEAKPATKSETKSDSPKAPAASKGSGSK